MALTLLTHPTANSYNFAGDPLIIRVSSDISGDPNLRCTANAQVFIDGDSYILPTIYALQDASGEFVFNFRKHFMDLFKMVLPDVPDPQLNALELMDKHLGMATIFIDEVSGDPPSVTDSVATPTFYLIRGGTAWEQFPTLNFLSALQPNNLQFLTWQRSPLTIRIDQPYYACFLQPYSQTDFVVEVNCMDKDGTLLGTISAFTQSSGPNTGIYCIPVGFKALGLDALAYADDIDRYTVHVRDGATILSELRLLFVDRSHRRFGRHFCWINSLGGLSEMTTKGESELSIQTKDQSATRFLPAEYNVTHGQLSTLDLSFQSSIKVNSGFTSRAKALEYSEILTATWVWELLTFPIDSDTVSVWVPIRKTGTNNRIVKDNDFQAILHMEYVYATKNNYFTPTI